MTTRAMIMWLASLFLVIGCDQGEKPGESGLHAGEQNRAQENEATAEVDAALAERTTEAEESKPTDDQTPFSTLVCETDSANDLCAGRTGNTADRGQDPTNQAAADPATDDQDSSRNLPPIYHGGAVSRKIEIGTPIRPIEPYFEDPEGQKLSYSIRDLPPGLSIDEDTGVIRGTPTESGRYPQLRIMARDTKGGVALSLPTFMIEVLDTSTQPCEMADCTDTIDFEHSDPQLAGNASSETPLAADSADGSGSMLANCSYWSAPGSQLVLAGQPITTLTSTCEYVGDITSAMALGSWPAGISYLATGNRIEIYGSPIEIGHYRGLSVQVRGDLGEAQSPLFQLSVLAGDAAPICNPVIEDQTITQGEPIALVDPQCSDESADSLRFSLTGTAPAGLSLDTGSGFLTGTPLETGRFSVAIQATDSAGNDARTNTFDLTITPYNCGPAELCLYAGNHFDGESRVYDVSQLSGFVEIAQPAGGHEWQSVINNSGYAMMLHYHNYDVGERLFSASSMMLDSLGGSRFLRGIDVAVNPADIPFASNVARCGEGQVCLWSGPDFTGENIVIQPASNNRSQWIYLSSYDYPDDVSYDFWEKVVSIENLTTQTIKFVVGQGKSIREVLADQRFDLTGTGCEYDVQGLYIP